MTWLRLGVVILAAHGAIFAQDKGKQEKAEPQYQEPPEEDVAIPPKEYTFNPLQASKEVRIGNYYFKKGSYKAAAHRFEEALKWNPSLADAAFRLGESREKLKDKPGAQEAFKKYLAIEPEGKEANLVKKKLGQK
ncbi:MAG: tetratricopeptide repeat protein [Bryobacteraceae bacterium]